MSKRASIGAFQWLTAAFFDYFVAKGRFPTFARPGMVDFYSFSLELK